MASRLRAKAASRRIPEHAMAKHHENTITVDFEEEGKKVYYNLPTVIGGKQQSEKEAVEHFRKTGKHLGRFDSLSEAVGSAIGRSKEK